MNKPTIVIFFNDWKVFPGGINAGGGESSTVAIARAFQRAGHRVIACANLPQGETTVDGIEYWNFGADYRVHEIAKRLETIGEFHCICATLAHPLLFMRNLSNCLSRLVINHAPSAMSSGLEPVTVMELIDGMVCVSHAQRSLVLCRGTKPEKVFVIRNGFDPVLFPYAGPEGRDFNKLIFIGRIEAPKGIHLLLQAYADLKLQMPQISLDIYGDESYWPEFVAQKATFEATMPGLKFHGKVPQSELSTHLRKAGLLVFPSISFESAGLSVVDAQASGCPVIGFGVGGVPEYLKDGTCGEVSYDMTAPALTQTLKRLLSNPERLKEMSRACATVGREHSWDHAAKEILVLLERIGKQGTAEITEVFGPSIARTESIERSDAYEVLKDHEKIGAGDIISDEEIESQIKKYPQKATPYLWRGLRSEARGNVAAAVNDYKESTKRAGSHDWQAHFRLTMISAEQRKLSEAATYARRVLQIFPDFPLKGALDRIIGFEQDFH